MSAKIIASAVCNNPEIKSSIKLASQAALDCIKAAKLDVNDVDYLINVGIYRDQNMVEPSMAALIQKELKINLDFTRFEVNSTAFSCDMMNGVNGAINACQVASAIFSNQKAKYVLIVSSDVHPSGEDVDSVPFSPCGAALLLAPSDENEAGFTQFNLNAGSINNAEGEVGKLEVEGFGANGRNLILVERDSDYIEKVQQLIIDSATNFISENNIGLEKTALIVPAIEEGFANAIGSKLGFNANNVIDTYKDYQYTHTSSFTCGFNQLKSLPKHIEQVIYVGAGAGLSAVCAAYRI